MVFVMRIRIAASLWGRTSHVLDSNVRSSTFSTRGLVTFAVPSCSLHAQKPRFLCSAINATLVESLLYIPLLTDDIQECSVLHNPENAVENYIKIHININL